MKQTLNRLRVKNPRVYEMGAYLVFGMLTTLVNWVVYELLKLALGLGVPLVVIVVWGLFLAPRAVNRADSTLGIVMTWGLFCLAALALLHAGRPVLCAAMLAAAAINRTLVVAWKQW